MMLNRRTLHQWFESQYGLTGLGRSLLHERGVEEVERKAWRLYQPAVILPVIHVDTLEQTLRNAEIVRHCGCKGFFLINQRFVQQTQKYAGYPLEDMLPVVKAVRTAFPDMFLGVNFLAVTGEHAFPVLARLARGGCMVDGYWADNAMIDERVEEQEEADQIERVRREVAGDWNGIYMGGVCFKAQREVPQRLWKTAARRSPGYMDVVMTSGTATGRAADLSKMAVIREGVGAVKPLGLASGVTPDNVTDYLGVVDVILVATGVSSSFHELDAAKLGFLLRRVSEWDSRSHHVGPPELLPNTSMSRSKRPCPGSPSTSSVVQVPPSLALRKQYLLHMSANTKDDLSKPDEMKHAWLDPSSACLEISSLIEDLLAPFVVGPLATRKPDMIVGADAAGFYYAGAMAHAMKCGFLSIRKSGKLPCSTTSVEYVNYTHRTNQLEIRTNYDLRGKSAILVDQWIETGGTMEGCIALLERLGVRILGICVVGLESKQKNRIKAIMEKYPVITSIPSCLTRHLNDRDLPAIHRALKHRVTPRPASHL
eukprot:Hpha_TRINITY_DN34653_c0_g1::TRINITY_DN34653_c0_g1_i1::g.21055::m.21055